MAELVNHDDRSESQQNQKHVSERAEVSEDQKEQRGGNDSQHDHP